MVQQQKRETVIPTVWQNKVSSGAEKRLLKQGFVKGRMPLIPLNVLPKDVGRPMELPGTLSFILLLGYRQKHFPSHIMRAAEKRSISLD